MNTAIDLLYLAKQSQIEILLNEDQLQVKLPRNGRIPENLLKEIKDNKKLLIDFLSTHKKVEKRQNKINGIDKTLFKHIPLSFSQERLLFIDSLEGTIQYHIPIVLRLKGNLNRKALEHALQNIVLRHEVLRTVIREEEGEAYQYVKDANEWRFPVFDRPQYKEDNKVLQQNIEQLIKEPFDLSKDYMLRSALIAIDPTDHVLVITIHHIATDGWSTSILIKELVEFYTACEESRPHRLPPLPIQYTDYAIWQRQYLAGEILENKIAYWKNKLHGITPLQLPTDFTRPAIQSSKGSIVGFGIDKQLSTALQELSHQQGTTIFMTFLAAFNVLLFRYSGQKDICVGSPIANRTQEELEALIGFFVNTLALRNELDGKKSFIDLLQQVKTTTLEGYANQDVPFEKVVESVVKERDMSRTPLFQVAFVLQNAQESSGVHLGDLKLLQEGFEHTTAKFDLYLNITHSVNGSQCGVEYCTDLFREETIVQMTVHFKELLLAIIKDPSQSITKLQMLNEEEQARLLVGFNDTYVDFPGAKNYVDLFEAQVLKTPGSTAVVFEEESLTYQQLNDRANQLANYLRSRGVREETLVPICLYRSLEMMIGIFGILKAGAAYVPIDPEYPLERISYMLDDTAATIIISSNQALAKLPISQDVEMVLLDKDWSIINDQLSENLQLTIQPAQLAYLIYTSGSTGKPKGVMIEHGSLVNRLNWAQSYYRLTAEDTVLQKTTFCFDVSVWEFLWPMLVGARLVFAKPEGHKDNAYLKSIIDGQQITMLHFVPSMLETFLADLEPGDCKKLKKVLCSGEALKSSQVQSFTQKLPSVELHNLYGPTEAAIDVTYWSLSEKESDSKKNIPIGKPVANTSIYILGPEGELVPTGCLGEIHIGGIQVARGYLNRAELTAEKFVSNPFSKEPGSTMYKTGDLGRWLPDGNIEYLGRKDDQVKIRGYRIELGEIEKCLSAIPGIMSAKVLLSENEDSIDKKLNAYVQVDKGQLPLLSNYLNLLNGHQVKRSDLHILPNGLPVLNANLNEVRFLYSEIFEDHCYLKHGITLHENSCVMDVGANAGFFTVFLNILSKDIRVYSFEPIPEVHHYLEANRQLYNIKGKDFELAILDTEKEVDFSYYPQVTIVSGLRDEIREVKDVVSSYIRNSDSEGILESEIDSLLDVKLEIKNIKCQAKTISQIIAQENIEKIDLLKVDVENSEHLVIKGIVPEDWQKIGSIIIEVHDVDGRLEYIRQLLNEKGFTTYVEKEKHLSKDHILYNLFALRDVHEKGMTALGDKEQIRMVGWQDPAEMIKRIKADLETKLPDYMIPAQIILLDQFPLTPNGKLDKKALPEPDASRQINEYVAPRNELENKLAKIWEALLKVERVGIHENFFELGGHSLLAMRFISLVRRELKIELPIKALFVHPTIGSLAGYVGVNDARLLLPPVEKIDPRPVHIPLSFSQERLWFIDRMSGTIQYHLPAILRLNGSVDKNALDYALQMVVSRHEVLRTVIREEDGNSWQFVKAPETWRLNIINGTQYKDDPAALRLYIQQIINAPFNLEHDWMLRADLIKLDEQDHILVATMHHIASDGWSMSIIVKEVAELYNSHLEGRPSILPQPVIQYADYAIWERNYLQGEVLGNKIAYWKEKLQSVAALQLNTDYPRTAVQSNKGTITGFRIEKELSEQLQSLSKQQGTTLFMTMLAAFNVLLYRYSNQEDICVGTSTAGRQQQELEELVGFFINTLALRIKLSSSDSFIGLLEQVKMTTLEAFEHQDVPFEKVVEAVVKERDMSRNPLFQVLFVLQNTPDVPELRLGDVSLSNEGYQQTTTQFELMFNLKETPLGIFGSVQYCTDLYTEQTIHRMTAHFIELLHSIVKSPTQRIGQLAILSVEEKRQLLVDFNNTSAEYAKDSNIISLFEKQAAKTPEAPALVFGEIELSYRQLNEQANQLAHYLQSLGVKAETLVPICIEPSVEMIIGILGILKAGGAYVPVDPGYPQERISYILEDTGAAVLICSEASSLKLADASPIKVIAIDVELSIIQQQSTDNPTATITPGQLAYIIYTSGSTGKPKGVMIEHRALINYLLNNKANYVASDKTGSGSFIHLSFTFDASLTALFMPLLSGKRIVIGTQQSINVFEDVNLEKYAPYDFIKITPSHLELLQEKLQDKDGKLLTGKLVIGGEALRPGHFDQMITERLEIEIINEYGPTEATVGCSVYRFQLPVDKDKIKQGIPIGKPIDNVSLYILGSDQELLPIGVKGELCIGGDGLARGYLNLEELTAEKFIPNPFSEIAGEKLYRTGDLCRWLADGNIEYLGRIDDQVKIRGYRVELGEIETVLMQSGMVSHAVVICREDKLGQNRLAGYIVPVEDLFERQSLSAYLKEKLPEYMIPSTLMELDILPLTNNGKIDKRALPDPEWVGSLTNEYIAPQTELEIGIAAIWKDLLEIEEISIHDDFFEIGGHSLMAIRVISAIRKQLDIELPINDIFDYPTIARLAAHLQDHDKGSTLPPIEVVSPRPEHIPLSFSQERLWFIDQLEGTVQYHVPGILRLKGNLNSKALANALKTIVGRHEVLRTVYREQDGLASQYILSNDEWNLIEEDGSTYKDDAGVLKSHIDQIISAAFDLSRDYMLRAVLINLNSEDHVLVYTIHHIASDGWSIAIIVKELVELYQAYEQNRPAQLPAIGIQYADYAIWQRSQIKGEVLERKINYWKEKLKDTAPLQVPADYRRPAVQSSRGATKGFRISKEITEKLLALSHKQGTTLFMTLLAALKVLLHRYSGHHDICIGTPIANRTQQELEGLIGFFLNSLALRSEVSGDNLFTDLLQQVRKTTLDAYANQDIPFEKVVDAVVKERDMGRTPLFQVMFVLQNAPEVPKLQLGEAKLMREAFEDNTSKFDISFTLTETALGLQGAVQYCTDLYREETIERITAHYINLLGSITIKPDQKVNELAILSNAEEEQLLVSFNDNAAAYSKEKSIVDSFEEQVAKTPTSIALEFEDQAISYQELNERSNRLANFLQKRGVGKEVMVALCIERSVEMLVGILGILKAGAGYVPIDPGYPKERISFMMEDTGASIVLTSAESSSKLPLLENVELVELDTQWSLIAAEPAGNPGISIAPNQLAYVIYTSGSTGKPKGVMIEHQGVVNLANTQSSYFGITSEERILQFSNYSFDASVEQIFLALFNGASLVLFKQGLQLDIDLFAQFLMQKKISHLHATPFFLENLPAANYPDLKRMIAGGDLCKPTLSNRWKDKLAFYNEYGPTETTVTAIEYHDKGINTDKSNSLSIGKPLSNTSVYILDEARHPVPIGGIGEIYIGGVQVARGYLNRPELTTERFVSNRFSQEPGARMYKTGDQGRWLADGNIEYLGRIDEQVKIRGYRIELGEIETVLVQSGMVSQAAIQVKEDAVGNKRLIGYVVPNGPFDKQEVIGYLNGKLPDYMVPALWVELETLPLTSNGKIDRKALPDADTSGLAANEFVSPQTEAETKLAGIWQDLLGVERVGVNDNFFELGGDSIITIQVVSRARRAGLELQPRDIFIHQTIRKLSLAIANRTASMNLGEQGILTGQSGLLPIQQLYFEKEQDNISHYNQSVLFSIDKSVSGLMISEAVKQLFIRHDALRFIYEQQEDGNWKQSYGSETAALITEDLRLVPMETLRSVIGQQSDKYQRSLDIRKGDLVRIVWMQTPEGEKANRLLMVIHHLAIDGVSWRILLEDFELLIEALKENKLLSSGTKGSSYRQWYTALEQYGQSNRLLSQKQYWQHAVDNYRPLPVDKDYTGAVRMKDAGHYSLRLGVDQTMALLQEVPRAYHTQINDILLAALALTICQWSKDNKVTIGLEGHGREDISEEIDSSRTVGWFTTLYPLLLEIDSAGGSDDLVKTVKEQLRLLPDRGLGYGVLKYINKEENLQGKEPWDITFNYLGQSDNVVSENKGLTGARESKGQSMSSEYVVGEKLSINGMIQGGQLTLDWTYSTRHFHEETISRLVENYQLNLESLIRHCKEQSTVVFTPSDYGLAKEISYQELDEFLNESFEGSARKESVESIYRLSGLQQGMLFHSLYNEEGAHYTEQFCCNLTGVDIQALSKSWEKILQHHSILRSAFYYDVFSIPIQVVYHDIEIPLTLIDYRRFSKEAQDIKLKEFQQADLIKGFDFKTPPLMRLSLIRTTEEIYRMIWTSHHILFDGWSMPILMEEFLSTYGSLVAGNDLKEPEPDQYEDYIRYIERKDKEKEEIFWRDYLKGLEQSTLLPFITGNAERTKGAGSYKTISLQINAADTAKIQGYAQKHHLTVNTIMQGVWSCLLHHYTGNNDIVYGVIVSGRPDDLPGVEKRVGMYINTIPIHSAMQPQQDVAGWLQSLQEGQVASREYQYTPLFEIQQWAGLEGDMFDSLLVFENYPVSKVVASRQWSLQVDNVQVEEQTNYPLTIIIGSAEQIGIRFSYNTALLEEALVKEIGVHFENVLNQLIENASGRLSDIRLLTQDKEQQQLVAFNNTITEYPSDKTIVSLFEEQVLKTPGAQALVFKKETLTYHQLNERSNQLAHYLKRCGVNEETLVPICIERSLNMMVGILGILKAGGAYVPIDPGYPQDRINYMLNDTAAKIIVSSKRSRSKLNKSNGIDIIELDNDWSKFAHESPANPVSLSDPHKLAYVIYTSGSTGRPKGVLVEQLNVVSLVKGVSYVSLSNADILLSTGSSSFDATTFEYWGMLLNGGKLVLCTEERLLGN